MGPASIQPSGAPFAAAVDSPDHPPQVQIVHGVTYRPQWDFSTGSWDMVDPLGRSLYSSTVAVTPEKAKACHAPGQEPHSELDRFRAASGPAAKELIHQKKMQAAFDRMMAERGPELQRLTAQLRNAERSDAPWKDRQAQVDGIKAEMRKITDQYAPAAPLPALSNCARRDELGDGGLGSMPGASKGLPSMPSSLFVPLPTNMAHAPDIVPTRAQPFDTVGGLDFEHEAMRSGIETAYAYDLRNTGSQVANDLERLAKTGYKEIHVLSGRHGLPNSSFGSPVPEQLKLDRLSASDTQQRHQGLAIKVYDAANPRDLQQFIKLQRDAAAGKLANGATLDAICYGRNRMSDPTGEGPVTSISTRDAKAAATVLGGAAIASGGLMIKDGLSDTNQTIGAVKIGAGTTQAAGGSAYVLGMLTDSSRLAKAGSVVGQVGGTAATALTYVDVYRHAHQHIALDDPRPRAQQQTEALMDGLALGSAMFSSFALPALALRFGAMPMAEAAAQKAAPTFIGGMSQAYGIPDRYLWGW